MAMKPRLVHTGSALKVLAIGLFLLLIATNLYWYTRYVSLEASKPLGSSNCSYAWEMLANLSKKYDALLTEKAELEAKYSRLLENYNLLVSRIRNASKLLENIALVDAYFSLNKSISLLLRETIARTSIGEHTKLFITPSQMLDTLTIILGHGLSRQPVEKAIRSIYDWVVENITSTRDQPFIRLYVTYLEVDGKKFAANISYTYSEEFIQTDIETLERHAGDGLDKALLLTSLYQEYFSLFGGGEAFLVYTSIPGAAVYAVIVVDKHGSSAEYYVADPLAKLYGPYSSPSTAMKEWLKSYGLTESDVKTVKIVNNDIYAEKTWRELIDFLLGEKK